HFRLERRFVPEPSRILIVDDDDDGRSFVKELLESDGYVVSEARDGRAALELLTSAPEPSLVILDLEMPVMSGAELLVAMKERERLARLPVLVVSGSGKMVIPLEEPVVGFLPKPVEGDELVGKVKACIASRTRGHSHGA
ncbi:MAG TPA: response regulator, partial [Polyangiaceae bacterium]|nr:response regulator [Polyangiaceae bacterium]